MVRFGLGAAALSLLLAACSLPFDLGQPTTRSLESEAADAMGPSATFTVRGTYTAHGSLWKIGITFVRPDRESLNVAWSNGNVEAIVIGSQAYFRGESFLLAHMGSDPQAQALAKAAGNAWWKGSTALLPAMPDLATGAAFRTTFLGAAVTGRTNDVPIDGENTIELYGPRGAVYIRSAEPHYLVHLRMKAGVSIDGIAGADLSYSSFNAALTIAPPTDVIDFTNLSTLPPIYTIVSIDTSRCSTECVVSAQLRNLGGLTGARAASTVTFTLTSGGATLGSCSTQVNPDVGYNSTTTVTCTIAYSGSLDSGANVTAAVDNPGRG